MPPRRTYFKVTKHRGPFVESTLAPLVFATVDPSSLVRAPDPDIRHRETGQFVADLCLMADQLDTRDRRP
jgi:DNA polymerase